jgi:hypothetical protein
VGPHAERVALDLEQRAAVKEPVNHRDGDGGVVEDLAPGGTDGAIGGEDDRALEVALRDGLEKRRRRLLWQRQVSRRRNAWWSPSALDGGFVTAGDEGGGGEVDPIRPRRRAGPGSRRAWSYRLRAGRPGARWRPRRRCGGWPAPARACGRWRLGVEVEVLQPPGCRQ